MRCLVMFITAVCLLFLLKLKWPKNKSVYVLAINLFAGLRVFLAGLGNSSEFLGFFIEVSKEI